MSPVLKAIYHLEIANEVLWERKRNKVKFKVFEEDVLYVKLKCEEDVENIRENLALITDTREIKKENLYKCSWLSKGNEKFFSFPSCQKNPPKTKKCVKQV